MNIQNIYFLFWIYSILGWCMETTIVSISKKRFINRGFFIGPYCPIYGTGGILLLSISKYKTEPIVVFILSIVICSVVEYLTSYFLELIYRIRWWDYSNRMFNINGRICLFNAICFGLLGMIMVCFLNPYFLDILNSFNYTIKLIITIILGLGTTFDIVITFVTMFDIKKTVLSIKDKTIGNLFKTNKDSTEEISKKVRSIIKDKSIIHKHLTKAYSNFKVYKNYFLEKKDVIVKLKLKEKLENRFIVTSIISIIIGYIIGILINHIWLSIIICFVLGLIIVRSINGK